MPRNELNWLPLDEALAGAGPAKLEFEAEIKKEATRMQNCIIIADGGCNKTASLLISFASNADPENYFIRGRAMIEIFRRHRVLSGYYGDRKTDNAQHEETDSGWTTKLWRPRRTGLFKVSYVLNKTGIGRQTVNYIANPVDEMKAAGRG